MLSTTGRLVALVVAVAAIGVGIDSTPGISAGDTGFLRVTTSPAVTSRISIDGIVRTDWGVQPLAVPAGQHEVCFTDVPGFTTPPCTNLSVAAGETIEHQAVFGELGQLKVEVDPAGLPSTIFVDGQPRDEYGLYAFIEPGPHEICWGDVPGHRAPACQTVDVTAGQLATVTGSFQVDESSPPGPAPTLGPHGFLRVTTEPAVPSRIIVDDVPRSDFGLGPIKFPVGTHRVCFTDVPGFATPRCRDVLVVEGETAPTVGQFQPLGQLKVDVAPAGLPTEIIVDGVARDRYGLYTFIEPGTYNICGNPIDGAALPGCVDVQVDPGSQANAELVYASSEPGPSAVVFVETFDVDPASPTVFSSPRWDIRRNSTNYTLWGVAEPMDGMHGPDCAGPPASHHIADWKTEGVYNCKNHLMTAANGDQYGFVGLTPAVMVDLSGEATISWNMSTEEMSRRDWVDLWITPPDNYMALPCGFKCPTYDGKPLNGIHAEKDGPLWRIEVMRDGASAGYVELYSSVVPDMRTRTLFEMKLTPNGLTFGTPENGERVRLDVPLGFTTGFVQWAQHSYNPTKDNSGVPATWHWDNFHIAPAIPFQMIKATTERVIGQVGKTYTVTFDAPAPDGARLAFNAVCKVDLDFGGGFRPATKIKGTVQGPPETPHSFFEPMPAGTTQVRVKFSGDGWYDGFPCLFEDPVVFAP